MRVPKTVAAFLAVSTVAGLGVATTASPVQAATQSDAVCGYTITEKPRTLWYNHCGSGDIEIHLEGYGPLFDDTRCVGPGQTKIGSYYRFVSARSTGATC